MQQQIETLLSQGLTQRAVAAKLGISLSTVHRRAPKTSRTPRASRTYTSEEKQGMIDYYLTGESQREVARKFNTSQTVVHTALADTPRHPKKTVAKRKEYLTAEQNGIIKQHWTKEGWTKTKIAKSLNVSFNTVSKAIIEMGIEDDQPVRKMKSKDPIAGRVKISIPEKRMEVWVYPHQVEQTRKKYNIL